MKNLLITVLLLGFTGCSSTVRKPFMYEWGFCNTAEYNKLETSGEGHITGEAFFKLLNGNIQPVAGSQVTLDPVTEYSTKWFNECLRNINPCQVAQAPNSAMKNFHRSVYSDSTGRFEFKNLPAGDYYICTATYWTVNTGNVWFQYRGFGGSAPTTARTGGVLSDRITVTEDDDTKVVLTQKYDYTPTQTPPPVDPLRKTRRDFAAGTERGFAAKHIPVSVNTQGDNDEIIQFESNASDRFRCSSMSAVAKNKMKELGFVSYRCNDGSPGSMNTFPLR